ncbi:acetyltransferase [Marinobacter sp. M216]|uniref:Acetyltransferase n=1 Tax=Marinobacter albus TaxID=3030833 RepID=A0ABT7HAX2_9GAMM|nr:MULTISPECIES: acetyltransferase [unclassified Marinobacter]MBW7470214.1 acetyltransferase [Marinobacter sp. F4218]MDK9557522.1 acetyltransferase [Marinobacter sp. M216]
MKNPSALKKIGAVAVCAAGIIFSSPVLARDANKTQFPVVFAHGMSGFDDILGYDYWGDDYGTFVLDPCDKLFETNCNGDINDNQRSFVSSVTPFQSSEVRGYQLANNIESYMATSGASQVNIVSHSQGGIDARKAARLLRERKGYRVVQTHVSISSPHRGSSAAKFILDYYANSVTETLANYFGDVIYGSGNDAIAGAKQLVYNDYDPNDGVITGMKAFNQKYPSSTSYVANSVSLMTAQDGSSVNPALWLLSELIYDIDGDGYCYDDCNNDGAAGQGDGNPNERDDDGLVGINSQQQGYRMEYAECWGCLDYVWERTSLGYVSDINHPNSTQMTSSAYVINQDHLDVVGVGPDTFDEMEFYAAITDYIADRGN